MALIGYPGRRGPTCDVSASDEARNAPGGPGSATGGRVPSRRGGVAPLRRWPPMVRHRRSRRAWPRRELIPVKWFNLAGYCSKIAAMKGLRATRPGREFAASPAALALIFQAMMPLAAAARRTELDGQPR